MICNEINYNIIATGSAGNAVILNNIIMIDCGVSFVSLSKFYKMISLVLLTHEHSDHFNKRTIRKLATERPTLRFGCGKFLVNELINCGVKKTNIDVLEPQKKYLYGSIEIIPEPLVHNVPNQGYKVHFGSKRVFYATDTNNLDGITAYNYDLLMIEANFTEADIHERIRQKEELGQYVYEYNVLKNHLSKEKCDKWLAENVGENTVYMYMHCHAEREIGNEQYNAE